MAISLVPPPDDDFGPTDYDGMGGAKKPRKPRKPPETPAGKTAIIIAIEKGKQPEHGAILDAMSRAIGANERCFRRDGRLVQVLEDDTRTLAIKPLTQGSIRDYAHRKAVFIVVDARGYPDEVSPPATHSRELLEIGTYPGVRYLAGITTAPMLRPDGTILQVAGYDAATGYLYEPSEAYAEVPAYPSPADAQQALQALREPFAEMAYVSEAARMVPVALALTLLARPAIDGPTPMFAIDATAAGSGKTLSLTVATTIALGAPAPATTWHDNEDEREKQLAGLALGAARVNVWDNVSSRLGGDALEAVLTATRRSSRRLGSSGQIDTSWHTVLCCSGNQLRIASDMRRRVLFGRIEPQVEDPSRLTGFAIGNLATWTKANRSRLVVAALTVLRFSAVAKAVHDPKANWGSYEAWCAVVRDAILSAGGPDILDARAGEEWDERANIEKRFFELLKALSPFTSKTIADRIQRLPRDERGTDDAELREILQELMPARERIGGMAPTSFRVGKILQSCKGTWRGNLSIISEKPRADTNVWRVVALGENGGLVGLVG